MKLARYFISVFALILAAGLVHAVDGQAEFSWSAPTVRVDGAALPNNEIGSYRIYSSRIAGELLAEADATTALNRVVDLPNNGTLTHTATFTVTDGETLYFAMTTVDTDGNEGPLSNVLSKQFVVPKVDPEAPILRSVTVKFSVIQ